MKIALIGGYGLVGSSIRRLIKISNELQSNPKFSNFTLKSYPRTTLDLLYRLESKNIIASFNPDVIINCAAMVGGLGAHKDKHSEFYSINTQINLNIWEIAASLKCRLISLNSVAAFPANLSLLKEDLINEGEVHSSEKGYALAKRHSDSLIQLSREEGLDFCSIFPTNIYGPNDNFNLKNAHVVASLIHKVHLANENHTDLDVWGDGRSLRQFIYVDDLAYIILKLLTLDKLPDRLICANPVTYNILDVAEEIKRIAKFRGSIITRDMQSNNGLRARECDVTKLKSIISMPFTDLSQGLENTWKWFVENYPNVRK